MDDKLNQYIACGLCSAVSRVKEGYPAMAQGFVTGFAFVYVLEKLSSTIESSAATETATGAGAGASSSGRQAIEGAVASKLGTPSKGSIPVRASALRASAVRRGGGRYYGISPKGAMKFP